MKDNQDWAMITGTTSGLGGALTTILLEKGWSVLGMARRGAPVQHPRYHHLAVDLKDPETAAQAIREAWSRLRPPQLHRLALVNNAAALGPIGPLHRCSPQEILEITALNQVTPLWLMGFVRQEGQAADLRVINVSSGAAYSPYDGWGLYCATKAGLLMGGRVMAEEWERLRRLGQGPKSFGIVSYSPGVVDTPMQAAVRGAAAADFPEVDKFVNLNREGNLVAPARTAAVMADLLNGGPLRPWSELRFGDALSLARKTE